jgi:uncharacterized YccA/Bax inhibitor family protein
VIQAVGLTFGTLALLLLAYKTWFIKPTENFRLMIFAATGGIAVLYLVRFVMGFFDSSIGFIHSNGCSELDSIFLSWRLQPLTLCLILTLSRRVLNREHQNIWSGTARSVSW